MELAAIDMPRTEARRAYLEYREAIREEQYRELDEVQTRQLAQDRAIAAAYRHVSIGRQLIRLGDTIMAGGFDDRLRPKLAIMRADFETVEVDRFRSGEIRYQPWTGSWSNPHRAPSKVIRVNGPGCTGSYGVHGLATLPPIPPQFRPNKHLRNYHLLFEASWRAVQRSRGRVRTGDPALLKWLGGDLWAVLAVWDLTPVEAAALEGGAV